MTTIVTAADAAQFLSLVPGLLGFHPRRSLVLVPFDGTRSLGAMRIDLPPTDRDDDVDGFAATVVGMVCRVADADALALVVFADESPGSPRPALARAVRRRADACGLRVTDALWVGPAGWGSFLEPGPPRDSAEIVPRGVGDLGDPPGDQGAGAVLHPATSDDCARVASALASLGHAVSDVCGTDAAPTRGAQENPESEGARIDPRALAALCRLDDLPTLFEDALGWDPPTVDPYELAAVAWCLARPALRDIAVVEWCGGMDAGDAALDAQLRWEDGEEYPAHLAMHMWGEGERPDAGRLVRALGLVRRVASVSPEQYRAGALATAAWLSWALGRSTHAELYAREACELEPEHGLAEIVRSFVHVGHLPDWAFRRPSTAA